MKLNCRPGDLAVITQSNDPRNVGKLVKVLRPYEHREASWWIVSTSVLHGWFGDWPAGAEVAQFDKNLRPIRDPGENAVDETLTWLPVPFPELVSA